MELFDVPIALLGGHVQIPVTCPVGCAGEVGVEVQKCINNDYTPA